MTHCNIVSYGTVQLHYKATKASICCYLPSLLPTHLPSLLFSSFLLSSLTSFLPSFLPPYLLSYFSTFIHPSYSFRCLFIFFTFFIPYFFLLNPHSSIFFPFSFLFLLQYGKLNLGRTNRQPYRTG